MVPFVLFALLFTKHILLGALGGPLMISEVILFFFCVKALQFCCIDWGWLYNIVY